MVEQGHSDRNHWEFISVFQEQKTKHWECTGLLKPQSPTHPSDTSLSITSNFLKLPKQFSQWGTSCSIISAFGSFSYSSHYRILKCLCTDVYFFPLDLKLFSTYSPLFHVGIDIYVCLCPYVQRPEVKLSCSLHIPFTMFFERRSLR